MESNKQNSGLNPVDQTDLVDFENIDPFEIPTGNPEAEISDADLKLKQQDSSATDKLQDPASAEDDRDSRSVFVKNVHFSATKPEIEEHFKECGEIKLITIMTNKMTH